MPQSSGGCTALRSRRRCRPCSAVRPGRRSIRRSPVDRTLCKTRTEYHPGYVFGPGEKSLRGVGVVLVEALRVFSRIVASWPSIGDPDVAVGVEGCAWTAGTVSWRRLQRPSCAEVSSARRRSSVRLRGEGREPRRAGCHAAWQVLSSCVASSLAHPSCRRERRRARFGLVRAARRAVARAACDGRLFILAHSSDRQRAVGFGPQRLALFCSRPLAPPSRLSTNGDGSSGTVSKVVRRPPLLRRVDLAPESSMSIWPLRSATRSGSLWPEPVAGRRGPSSGFSSSGVSAFAEPITEPAGHACAANWTLVQTFSRWALSRISEGGRVTGRCGRCWLRRACV